MKSDFNQIKQILGAITLKQWLAVIAVIAGGYALLVLTLAAFG